MNERQRSLHSHKDDLRQHRSDSDSVFFLCALRIISMRIAYSCNAYVFVLSKSDN